MDMSLSKLWEIAEDGGTWHAAVHGSLQEYRNFNKCFYLYYPINHPHSVYQMNIVTACHYFDKERDKIYTKWLDCQLVDSDTKQDTSYWDYWVWKPFCVLWFLFVGNRLQPS